MGLLEDVMEKSVPGMVVGALAAAVLLPFVGGARAAGVAGADGRARRGVGRSLMKAAVAGYVTVADGVKEVTAEAREQLGDLAAEVREERRARAEAERAAEEPAGAGAMPGGATS
jgi:hypothetical protein